MRNITTKPKSSNEKVSSALPASNIHKSSSKKHDKANRSGSTSPHLVDLSRSCHQRFCKSLAQNLKRYLICFMPVESKSKSHNVLLVEECSSVHSPKNNCNYYTNMNDEERDENLKSVITYCKDSTDLVK